MFGIKKGLFGKGWTPPIAATPGIGDGDPRLPQNLPENDPAPGLGMRSEQPKQDKGLFRMGGPVRGIAGMVGDVLMQHNGFQPVYAPVMQQQQKALAEQAAEQRRRSQEMADWQAKKQYEWNNAPEPNNDTVRDFEWYASLTPEQREIYHDMKPQLVQGADGLMYPVRKTPPPPDTLPPDFDFGEGGPSQSAAGGFPSGR